MSFLAPDSSFETYGQNWDSGGSPRLVEQFCNVSHFLCRIRRQLRYGELSRPPYSFALANARGHN